MLVLQKRTRKSFFIFFCILLNFGPSDRNPFIENYVEDRIKRIPMGPSTEWAVELYRWEDNEGTLDSTMAKCVPKANRESLHEESPTEKV